MVHLGSAAGFLVALTALTDPAESFVHKKWHLQSPANVALRLRGGATPSDRGDVPLLEVYPEIKPVVLQKAVKPPVSKTLRPIR